MVIIDEAHNLMDAISNAHLLEGVARHPVSFITKSSLLSQREREDV